MKISSPVSHRPCCSILGHQPLLDRDGVRAKDVYYDYLLIIKNKIKSICIVI
jgi:hypothetical protein